MTADIKNQVYSLEKQIKKHRILRNACTICHYHSKAKEYGQLIYDLEHKLIQIKLKEAK